MTTLLAAAILAAVGTPVLGWAAVPLAGAGLGLVEAARGRLGGPQANGRIDRAFRAVRGRPGAPSTAWTVAGRGAAAGAAGWAILLFWRARDAPVSDVAGLLGSVAGGLPTSLVVVFALVLPALLAGTAAGAAFVLTGSAFDVADLRRTEDG